MKRKTQSIHFELRENKFRSLILSKVEGDSQPELETQVSIVLDTLLNPGKLGFARFIEIAPNIYLNVNEVVQFCVAEVLEEK